jgi:hypothetical protein
VSALPDLYEASRADLLQSSQLFCVKKNRSNIKSNLKKFMHDQH